MVRWIALVVTAWLSGLMAAPPAHFRLQDTAGDWHTEAEWKGVRAVVVVFLATDCPISNGYVPELRRIYEKYSPLGVKFYGVQPNAMEKPEEAATFVREFGLPFPLLFDPKHALVNATGAVTTPEVALLSASGATAYLGRIDNLYAQIGQKRYAATEFDLRNAIDAVLAGKPVAKARTKSVGCTIPKL